MLANITYEVFLLYIIHLICYCIWCRYKNNNYMLHFSVTSIKNIIKLVKLFGEFEKRTF